jgi:hypothetical protein
MPILSPSNLHGKVRALLHNPSRDAQLETTPHERLAFTYAGIPGETHGGLTRPSCSRVLKQYPKRGTEIRNTRQVSIVSVEDLAEIASRLTSPDLPPEWIGANLVVEGIPDFTMVPPSSRLIFEGGVTLTVDMENAPCRFPGEVIERHHPGRGAAFPKIAVGLRGVTAWVEREGEIAVGETCRLHCPPQRIYAHI